MEMADNGEDGGLPVNNVINDTPLDVKESALEIGSEFKERERIVSHEEEGVYTAIESNNDVEKDSLQSFEDQKEDGFGGGDLITREGKDGEFNNLNVNRNDDSTYNGESNSNSFEEDDFEKEEKDFGNENNGDSETLKVRPPLNDNNGPRRFVNSHRSTPTYVTEPVSSRADDPPRHEMIRENVKQHSRSVRVHRKQGISIVTFDPNQEPNFTEYYTNKAIEMLGLTAKDLCYPTEAILNTYSREPELRKKVKDQLIERSNELIEQVIAKRKELIQQSTMPREARESDFSHLNALTNEDRRRLEAQQRRQKREIEQLIYNLVYQQQQAQLAKQREEQRLQQMRIREQELARKHHEEQENRVRKQAEMEEIARQKRKREEEIRRIAYEREMQNKQRHEEEAKRKAEEARLEEKRRQEKLEQQQRYIAEVEAKRQKMIQDKERAKEIKEERRLKVKEAEMRQRQLENEEKQRQTKELLRRIAKKNADDIKRKRIEAEYRNQKALENYNRAEQIKQDQRRAIHEKEKQKLEQFALTRKRIDDEKMKINERLMLQMNLADKRYRQIEHEKMMKSVLASQGYTDNLKKIQEKMNQINHKLEQRNRVIMQKLTESEMRANIARAETEKRRRMKSIELRLKNEYKAFRALRQERTREAQKAALRARFEERVKEIEHQQEIMGQQKRANERKHKVLENERARLVEKINALNRINSNASGEAIRQLANEFNIDINQIYEKVASKQRGSAPFMLESSLK